MRVIKWSTLNISVTTILGSKSSRLIVKVLLVFNHYLWEIENMLVDR